MRHHKITTELGFKSRPAHWTQLLPLLLINKHSYRCHRPPLRKEGHGENPGPWGEDLTDARGVTPCLLRGSPLNPRSPKLWREAQQASPSTEIPKSRKHVFFLGLSKACTVLGWQSPHCWYSLNGEQLLNFSSPPKELPPASASLHLAWHQASFTQRSVPLSIHAHLPSNLAHHVAPSPTALAVPWETHCQELLLAPLYSTPHERWN